MYHPSRPPPTDDPLPNNTGVASTASRFFVSMRRSFSPPAPPRRKSVEPRRAAMYSTPEERHPHSPSRAGPSRYLDSRPTIQQIAMGLHLSRTPHLRPVPNTFQRHALPSPPPRRNLSPPMDNLLDTSTTSSQCRARHSLPPPPSRSSMKKTSPSVSTLDQSQHPSASAVASAGPSRPLSSLRVRMSKLIPGYRPLSLPSSFGRASSFTSSGSGSTRPATPRKAVRFSTSVLAIDEHSS